MQAVNSGAAVPQLPSAHTRTLLPHVYSPCAGESGGVQPLIAFERVVATHEEAATTSTAIHEQATATVNPPVRLTLLSATTTFVSSPEEVSRGDSIPSNGLHSFRATAARAPAAQVSGPGRLNVNIQRSVRGRHAFTGHHISSANRLHSVSSSRSFHKKYSCALPYHTDHDRAHLLKNKIVACFQYKYCCHQLKWGQSYCAYVLSISCSVSVVQCALNFHSRS